MRKTILAALAASVLLSTPVFAQDRDRRQNRSSQPSPLAQQAVAGGQQPDVLLDVPNLSVEEITLEVNNLQVDI